MAAQSRPWILPSASVSPGAEIAFARGSASAGANHSPSTEESVSEPPSRLLLGEDCEKALAIMNLELL